MYNERLTLETFSNIFLTKLENEKVKPTKLKFRGRNSQQNDKIINYHPKTSLLHKTPAISSTIQV